MHSHECTQSLTDMVMNGHSHERTWSRTDTAMNGHGHEHTQVYGQLRLHQRKCLIDSKRQM